MKITDFKYLYLLLVANIVFQLISDVTASRLVDVFGTAVSITVLYFPFTYIFSDATTEVYGYKAARRVLWITMVCSIIAGLIYQLTLHLPASFVQQDISSYETIFGQVPRILIGGWVAVFFGDITNNFILSKMKTMMAGKLLWLRVIVSTIGGQFVNTGVFYTVALYGVLPNNVLVQAVLVGSMCKIVVETLMTPVTCFVIEKLKKAEGVDVFDKDINYNPFKF